jgi:hypothetical protein
LRSSTDAGALARRRSILPHREKLRGSGSSPAAGRVELELGQRLRGSGSAPAEGRDELDLGQRLRGSGSAPAEGRDELDLGQRLRGSPRAPAWRMAGASAARRRAASRPLFQGAARPTSDELTVLYSNGPDDRSVKLALGYVTAATCGC